MVRTRIAPSPTGFAHVGTAYTALLNYAFAKKNKGKFIIRIEDSDTKRNVEGAENKIYEALDWLGIDWDEGETKGGKYGPYLLSKRLDFYKKKATELLELEKAYEDSGAIRFKNTGKDMAWHDLVRGDVDFPGGEITDFVIMKSDGYPTYNFNVVVDDIAMGITHVIRGEDHVSNTPRQLALYEAFGAKPPFFAHHPMLQSRERKKLSKRDAAVDVFEYKKAGYLPEAFVNFLCLQGWSHPEGKDIFSMQEFVSNFDISRVRPSGAVFDTKKLDWINGEYIRNLEIQDLGFKIQEFFGGKYDEDKIAEVLPLVQSRIKTLGEFGTLAGFFFNRPKLTWDQVNGLNKKHLKASLKAIENAEVWEKDNLDKAFLEVIDENGFKTGDFFMDLRVAISGSRFTPPITESILILGKNEAISRISFVLKR